MNPDTNPLPPPLPPGVLVVRPGRGANCSSIGSIVDMLFGASVFGGALVVALTAWLEGRGEPGEGADPNEGSGPKEGQAPSEGRGAASEGNAADGQKQGAEGARRVVRELGAVRARLEPFGAWIRLDEPPLLIAVDRELARKLGFEGGALWSDPGAEGPNAPLEAHVAVTERCTLPCEGCYLDASPEGASPPVEVLTGRLRAIAEQGAFSVAFGGGEPLVRDDLGELAWQARSFGLSPVLTTSGVGMTAGRAAELRAFDQVNVSYDGEGELYRAVRGFSGAAMAERAMDHLREAGVRFGVNVVLTRRSFGGVEAAVQRAREFGAAEVQLLRFKPSGRGVGAIYEAARLDEAQARSLYSLIGRLSAGPGSVRIDCALVPFLSPQLDDASALERFGVFGCEAGRHLGALRADGAEAPCSFAPPEPRGAPGRLGRGAKRGEARRLALAPGAGVARGFREHSDRPPEPCSSCSLRRVCRGGCRVVAAHAGEPEGPDPECPRVLDFRRAGGGLA